LTDNPPAVRPTPAPAEQRPRGAGAKLAAAGLAAYLCTAAFYRTLQFLSPYLPENDGYYHIKMAFLMRTTGVMRSFPWARLGLWSEHFFDKDFLFHFILQAFTFGDLQYGAKWAAVLLGALGPAALYYSLRRSKALLPELWLFLLLSSGSFFLYRDLVPRPQILSIFLSVAAMHHILRRQFVWAGVVAFLYTLAYAAPFVTAAYALVFIGACYWVEKKADWRILAAVALGLLAGTLVHPNFPNNFRNWYVQDVQTLLSSWSGDVDLRAGGELSSMNARALVTVSTAAFFPYFGAILYSVLAGLKADAGQITLLITSFCFFVLTLMTKRFSEYWTPFSLWYAASVATQAYREGSRPFGALRRLRGPKGRAALAGGAALAVAALAVLFARSCANVAPSFSRAGPSRMEGAAAWLRSHVPEGETVYTCDWDDAPELFFFDSSHSYLVFLDPNFLYRWDPGLWRLWNQTSNGLNVNLYETMRDVFRARYGFCTSDFTRLRTQMAQDPRFEIVYSSPYNYIFKRGDTRLKGAGRLPDPPLSPGPFETDWLHSRAVSYDFDAGPASAEQWSRLPKEAVSGGIINLLGLGLGADEYACVFLKQEIHMRQDVSGRVFLGSDDGCALFVNGRQVYRNPAARELQLDVDRIDIRLKKGRNSVVAKVCNITKDWAFAARYSRSVLANRVK